MPRWDMTAVSRPASLLVVAPDDDLRRSLCFVLRAEGYGVRESQRWPETGDMPVFDAAVIDHGGIDRAATEDQALRSLGARAVILSSRMAAPSNLALATIVRKPLIGRELVECLHALLSDTPPAPKTH